MKRTRKLTKENNMDVTRELRRQKVGKVGKVKSIIFCTNRKKGSKRKVMYYEDKKEKIILLEGSKNKE